MDLSSRTSLKSGILQPTNLSLLYNLTLMSKRKKERRPTSLLAPPIFSPRGMGVVGTGFLLLDYLLLSKCELYVAEFSASSGLGEGADTQQHLSFWASNRYSSNTAITPLVQQKSDVGLLRRGIGSVRHAVWPMRSQLLLMMLLLLLMLLLRGRGEGILLLERKRCLEDQLCRLIPVKKTRCLKGTTK